jgi:N-acetylglutamate synthase-like GNAT family acetyltransferase
MDDPRMSYATACASPAIGISIRQAVPEDLPIILSLLQELGPHEEPLPLARANEIFARMAAANSRVWVAERDGEAVGTYTLLVMENLCHGGTPSAIIESVVVACEARGGRIGERMMRHAMEQAKEAGCYKLALSSNRRRLEAHRFYQRLGFAQHGVSLAIINGPGCRTQTAGRNEQ